MELATVIEGRVAACAENADDARLMSAQSSCSAEHITFHADASSGAERLPQGLCHDGSLFGCTSCSVEVDGFNAVKVCMKGGAELVTKNRGDVCL